MRTHILALIGLAALSAAAASCEKPLPDDELIVYEACGPVRQRCDDGVPVREELLVIDGVCVTRSRTLSMCADDQACVETARECDDEGCTAAQCVTDLCEPELNCADRAPFCDGDVSLIPSSNGSCSPQTGRCVDPDIITEFCAETGRVCHDGLCISPGSVCEPPCADGEVCRGNVCVDANSCNPPCGQFQECIDRQCVDREPVCDPPCLEDQRCREGVCVDRPPQGQFTAVRYATHRFAMVGESVSIDGLGTLLDEVGPTLARMDDAVQCAASGTECLRFDYGRIDLEHVQTACFVCLAARGSCDGLPLASLDLEPGAGVAAAEANYLASGTGALYRVCEGPDGLVAEVGRELPPLMLRVIDAFGPDAGGSVARGSEDMEIARDTPLMTLDTAELSPAWLTIMGHRLEDFALAEDGTITVAPPVCSSDAFSSIECSDDAAAVTEGDVFTISTGSVDTDEIDGLIRQRPARVAALAERHGSTLWAEDLSGLMDETRVRRAMVQRWIGIELFRAYALAFDETFDLRGRGIAISFFGHHSHRRALSTICHPDESMCADIEAELQAAEAAVLDGMRADGFGEIWLHIFLRYDAEGPRPLGEQPPHHALFDGAVIDVNTNANPPADELPPAENLAAALASIAGELGEAPVILSPWAGPMAFYVQGLFCEAQTCLPDFENYFALNERVLLAAIEHFGLERVQAFVVPLFDGDHFDIDAPLEGNIHRTGETGYNNPLLNPYLLR